MRVMTKNDLRRLFSDYRYWRHTNSRLDSVKLAVLFNPYVCREMVRRRKLMEQKK
jgi:hypothetical protein